MCFPCVAPSYPAAVGRYPTTIHAGYLLTAESVARGRRLAVAVVERAATALNDVTWAIASALASLACFETARSLSGRARTTSRLMAFGCGAWFAGQIVWNYHELWRGQLPGFPHWMQGLFLRLPAAVPERPSDAAEARRLPSRSGTSATSRSLPARSLSCSSLRCSSQPSRGSAASHRPSLPPCTVWRSRRCP